MTNTTGLQGIFTPNIVPLDSRGEIHEDPIVAAVSDPVSYVVGLFVAITMIAAL